MRFLLLSCTEDKTAPPPSRAEMETLLQGHLRFGEELGGKVIAGERLRPESDGCRIRLKAGQRQVTDGPFTETKEGLGGFYLIECDTKEEALAWAKKMPVREGGFIEVREIWPM